MYCEILIVLMLLSPALLMCPLLYPQMMARAEGQQRELMRSIEGLPPGGHFSSLDQDLLMLKATSMATMNCLNDCFHMLYQQHAALQKSSLPAGEWPPGGSTGHKRAIALFFIPPEEISGFSQLLLPLLAL